MFPRLYDTRSPLGYEGAIKVHVLLNPLPVLKKDWQLGGFACAAHLLVGAAPECEACQDKRARLGRALHVIYGQTPPDDLLDFSTAEAALATMERENAVPDEVLWWLIDLPTIVWQERQEQIRKNSHTSSEKPTGS